jgi:hypothetical protein
MTLLWKIYQRVYAGLAMNLLLCNILRILKMYFSIVNAVACYHIVQNVLQKLDYIKDIRLIWLYKTIVFSVGCYGYKTLSLKLMEESRKRVFENRIFRTIFGPKRDKVVGGWRKLWNENLPPRYTIFSVLFLHLCRFRLLSKLFSNLCPCFRDWKQNQVSCPRNTEGRAGNRD